MKFVTIAVAVATVALFACVHGSNDTKSVSAFSSGFNAATRFTSTTGFTTSIANGWERIPNIVETVENSYEQVSFLNRSTKALVAINTVDKAPVDDLIATFRYQAMQKDGVEATEIGTCKEITGALEFTVRIEGVYTRIIVVNGAQYSYVVQGFYRDEESDASVHTITSTFKVVK